jgi:hypothetical protein
MLLGSAQVKAACKMLVKLIPGGRVDKVEEGIDLAAIAVIGHVTFDAGVKLSKRFGRRMF